MKSEPKSSTTPSETKNGGGTSLSGETPKATPTTLAAKLLNIQKEVEAVTKDNKANTGKFSYKYADINSYIEVLKPVLNAHGVVVLQPLSHISVSSAGEDGPVAEIVPAIRTIIMDADTGERIEDVMPLPRGAFTHSEEAKDGKRTVTDKFDPQSDGSAITYYRRYSLASFFFLQAEDDDGAAAKPITNEGEPFI